MISDVIVRVGCYFYYYNNLFIWYVKEGEFQQQTKLKAFVLVFLTGRVVQLKWSIPLWAEHESL